MDLAEKADDNAEHLYRYLKKQQKEKIFFILSRSSKDWKRLENEGFNLIDFRSKIFEDAYIGSKYLISSHVNKYFTEYMGKYSTLNKKFIFLQHGVTKDNLSSWLNNTSRIDCMITTALPEQKSFSCVNSPYRLTEREVFLTGFPRHDNLIGRVDSTKHQILIMPTWRKSLSNHVNNPNGIKDFKKSCYYHNWQEFLSNPLLVDIARKNNCKVVFLPHPNLLAFVELFDISNEIEVLDCGDVSFQDFISQSALLITDYSSLAFEFAYLGKSTLYYHFDQESIFTGEHTYEKGYFDYENDGFGPIASSSNALLHNLDESLSNNYNYNEKYKTRMLQFFPFKDGKCCERTYDAILNLDQPNCTISQQLITAIKYSEQAMEAANWVLAEDRWQFVIDNQNQNNIIYPYLNIAEAQKQQGKLNAAKQSLTELELKETISSEAQKSSFELMKLRLLAEIYAAKHKWTIASEYWQKINANYLKSEVRFSDLLQWVNCVLQQGDKKSASKLLNRIAISRLDKVEFVMLLSLRHYFIGKVDLSIATIERAIQENVFSLLDLRQYKPELRLSTLYREQGLYNQSNQMLVNYEMHTKDDPQCRIEIGLLAAKRESWEKAFIQFRKAYPEGVQAMPIAHSALLIQAARLTARFKFAEEAIDMLLGLDEESFVLTEQAEMHMIRKNWAEAISAWLPLINKIDGATYRLIMAYRMSGQLKSALELLLAPTTTAPSNQEEWILRGDVAQLTERWDIALESWGVLLSHYPETAPSWVWKRYQAAQLLYRSITIDAA